MHDAVRNQEVLLKHPSLVDKEGIGREGDCQILPRAGVEDGAIGQVGAISNRGRVDNMVV